MFSRHFLNTTRYELAHLLNMPHESDDFQKLLKEMPCDEDWDENDFMESMYKKSGFKRYSRCFPGGLSLFREGSLLAYYLRCHSIFNDVSHGLS